MTSKEKAEEMVCSFEDFSSYPVYCALIAVIELIKESRDNEYTEKYWDEVKQEIQKL